eukprot:sb/3469018/
MKQKLAESTVVGHSQCSDVGGHIGFNMAVSTKQKSADSPVIYKPFQTGIKVSSDVKQLLLPDNLALVDAKSIDVNQTHTMLFLFLSTCFLPVVFSMKVEECYFSSNIDCPSNIYTAVTRQYDGCTLEDFCTAREEIQVIPDLCSFKILISCSRLPTQQPITATTKHDPAPGFTTFLKWGATAIGGFIAISLMCFYGPTILSCLMSITTACCNCCYTPTQPARAPVPPTRRVGRTETAETIV